MFDLKNYYSIFIIKNNFFFIEVFNFSLVSEFVVVELLKLFNIRKVIGCDLIFFRILKEGYFSFSCLICFLIN